MKKTLLTILTLGACLTTSQAALTLLADPNSATASSQFNGSFAANRLYDGTINPNDLAASSLGNDYAGSGVGNTGAGGSAGHTVTYNYTVAVDVGGFYYANRGGNGTNNVDQILQIEFWFGTTDTSGAADQIISVTASNHGTVAAYDFGSNVNTNTITMRLTGDDTVAGANNPGGSELALATHVAAVPEPSSTALLGLGGLALILRRRKK